MKEESKSIEQLFEEEVLSDMEEDVMTLFTEGNMIDLLADLPIYDDELDAMIDDDTSSDSNIIEEE